MSTLSTSAPEPGSAPLKNSSHEKFCLQNAAGICGRAAYRAAGYTKCGDRAADTAASRLLTIADVSARIGWLKKQAADTTVMDLREVLQELTKLGRSDIRNCIVGGDDTSEVLASIKDLAPEHSAAIQEMTVDTYIEGAGDDAREVKRVKVKLHDKRGALNELRRHHEPQKHEHTGAGGGPIETKETGEQMTPLELARRIAFALEAGARAAKAQPPAKAKPKAKPKKKAAAKPAAKVKPAAPAAAAPAPAAQPVKE